MEPHYHYGPSGHPSYVHIGSHQPEPPKERMVTMTENDYNSLVESSRKPLATAPETVTLSKKDFELLTQQTTAAPTSGVKWTYK